MLTESAPARMQAELRRLRQKFTELHEESLAAPLAKRRGGGLLLAMGEWEPAGFTKLRRKHERERRALSLPEEFLREPVVDHVLLVTQRIAVRIGVDRHEIRHVRQMIFALLKYLAV